MDNFTGLCTLYLRFTFGTTLMHVYWFSSTNLCCSSPSLKTVAGTINHVQIAQASVSPVELYACNSTSNHIIWVRQLHFEIFDLVRFQSWSCGPLAVLPWDCMIAWCCQAGKHCQNLDGEKALYRHNTAKLLFQLTSLSHTP